MLKDLIKIAGQLDKLNLKKEADLIDKMIRKIAEDNSEEFEFKPDDDLDPNRKSERFEKLYSDIDSAVQNGLSFIENNVDNFSSDLMSMMVDRLQCNSVSKFIFDLYKMRNSLSKEDSKRLSELSMHHTKIMEGIHSITDLGYRLRDRGIGMISRFTLESHNPGTGSLMHNRIQRYIDFLLNDLKPFVMSLEGKVILGEEKI